MAYSVNNFVIDRVLRGVMLSQADDSVLWALNQITNPSLSCSTDTEDAVDMLGTPIVTFERAKTVEFSAENALFDLGLWAAQGGTTVQVATSTAKITTPTFEEIKVTDASTITLKHTPVEAVAEIHVLNGDSTLGTAYKNGTAASATEFVNAAGSTTITLPTSGISIGDTVLVIYEYETENAVSVTQSATEFPKAGRFLMEVLGCDVCDQTTLIHAYVIIDNAKLTSDYDYTFSTDSTHSFTIRCNQQYCDAAKKLVSIVIPKED